MVDVGDDDRMIVTYQPGTGTEIGIKGMSQGTVAGKGFADALFSCWLGPVQPSKAFKVGLLGD